MRRLNRTMASKERGATAVTFALLMVVIITFVGLGVDGAAAFAKRQQMQNGADAAAFALAQAYALNGGCTEDVAMAEQYARANVTTETATVAADPDCLSAQKVRVDATGQQSPFFLQVANFGPVTVGASATVEWGSPRAGDVTFPLAFSTCEFEAQGGATGVPVLLLFTKDSPTWGVTNCHYATGGWPEMGNNFPGGFGFIVDAENRCHPHISADGWVLSKAGNTPPNTCTSSSFPPLPFTALIPLFDDCKTSKNNAACRKDTSLPSGGLGSEQYHISKYAAFRIAGYDFNAGLKDGIACPPSKKPCIQGAFVDYVSLDDTFEMGPVDPGSNAVIIRLVD